MKQHSRYVCLVSCAIVLLLRNTLAEESSDFLVEIIEKPTDCEVTSQKGNMLKLHYTGYLLNGEKFDSSLDRGDAFSFELGLGQVIKGWDQGLIDMCIGEKRKLTIPPRLGYGDEGAGDKIPGGSTLVFDVELLEISQGGHVINYFKEIDIDNDDLLSQDEVSVFVRKQEMEEGIVSTDESSHNALVADIFLHEDADKDGFISRDEFSGPKHDEL